MWIDVENARVFAQTGGQSFNSGKESVVLIHGAGMDQTVWQQQSRFSCASWLNVFAIDMPGHGSVKALRRIACAPLQSGSSPIDALDLPMSRLWGIRWVP